MPDKAAYRRAAPRPHGARPRRGPNGLNVPRRRVHLARTGTSTSTTSTPPTSGWSSTSPKVPGWRVAGDLQRGQPLPRPSSPAQMHTRPEAFWWTRSGEYDDDVPEGPLAAAAAFYGSPGVRRFQVVGDTIVVDERRGKRTSSCTSMRGPLPHRVPRSRQPAVLDERARSYYPLHGPDRHVFDQEWQEPSSACGPCISTTATST